MKSPQLHTSRIFSFLDDKANYALTFFEGQKIIFDLALLHGYGPNELSFVRDAVLCGEHLVQFFKSDENMGFYIDSESPDFIFKLESNPKGYVRTLKLPEDENPMPKKFTGNVRMVKISPHQREPYESIIRVTNESIEGIVDAVLKKSYQVEAQVLLAADADQSIMVSKLPTAADDGEPVSAARYLLQHKKDFVKIFAKHFNDVSNVVKSFEALGYQYLQNTEIRLHCPCDKENIIVTLFALIKSEVAHARTEGKDKIEVKCQYCKKTYHIGEDDIRSVKIN